VSRHDPVFYCAPVKFYDARRRVVSKPGALDRLPTDRLSVQDPRTVPHRDGHAHPRAIDGMRAAVDYLRGWVRV